MSGSRNYTDKISFMKFDEIYEIIAFNFFKSSKNHANSSKFLIMVSLSLWIEDIPD